MKVEIDAGGRRVCVETSDTNVSPDQVADKALAVWQATDGAPAGTQGPAYGFQAERRPTGSGPERWLGEGAPRPAYVESEL